MTLTYSLTCVVLVTIATAAPVRRQPPDANYDYRVEKDYLIRFKHIKLNPDQIGDEDFRKGLLSLQKFAKLEETGELDEATVRLMSTPRCGMPDIEEESGKRRKRYFTTTKWPTNDLTYRIGSFPSNTISPTDVVTLCRQAYKYWTDVCDLTINESNATNANMKINFFSRDHGDGYPFDGQSGILGHTWGSPWGNSHFDDSETWTNGTNSGTDFLQVATHEFGHILGMLHSGEPSAVMFPYYSGYNTDFKLNSDDINGIQSLYGTKLS